MEIHFVPRKEINRELWNQAVAATPKGLPYAYTWYLDIVGKGKWDGLIEGNYERVMPLVWNSKLFGVKQIYQPVLTQQLGVFGSLVTPVHIAAFIKAIPDDFKYIQMNLNEVVRDQKGGKGSLVIRRNLILNLNRPYQDIRKGYAKSLRKRLRQAQLKQRVSPIEDVELLIAFYQENLEHKVQLGKKNYAIVKALIDEMMNGGYGSLYEVSDQNGDLCCMGFFMQTEQRIINAFGASNQKGKVLHSMHFLLDYLIQMHSGKAIVFDFEGSDHPGIADFFRSFGSSEENYSEYKIDLLPPLISMIKHRSIY